MTSRNSDPVGLCATCAHSQIVKGARSKFYMCTLSFTDNRFRKYPPLPVRQCVGYEPIQSGERSDPPLTPDER